MATASLPLRGNPSLTQKTKKMKQLIKQTTKEKPATKGQPKKTAADKKNVAASEVKGKPEEIIESNPKPQTKKKKVVDSSAKPQEIKKEKKFYVDHAGNKVPEAYVDKFDKKKHHAAIKFHARAKELNKELLAFKTAMLKACDDIYDQALAENKIKPRENANGSYSVCTFDKKLKIEVNVHGLLRFNDNIKLAHAKIKEWVSLKTDAMDDDMAIYVQAAFESTKGNLDTNKIISLMKMKIKHHLWMEAMELIRKSIETNHTKRYVRISERQPDGQYKYILLDIAQL